MEESRKGLVNDNILAHTPYQKIVCREITQQPTLYTTKKNQWEFREIKEREIFLCLTVNCNPESQSAL